MLPTIMRAKRDTHRIELWIGVRIGQRLTESSKGGQPYGPRAPRNDTPGSVINAHPSTPLRRFLVAASFKMACACAALYFFNLRGDVLIQRTYRDDTE